MGRVIHFEILGENPQTLADFYKSVFGWEVSSWAGGEQTYWLVTTGAPDQPGINGGIMARHFKQGVINTIQVDSLDAAIAQVEQAGGAKIQGPNDVPNVGTTAYCSDPEGNLFGLLQPSTAP
jgi:hypothetical protein